MPDKAPKNSRLPHSLDSVNSINVDGLGFSPRSCLSAIDFFCGAGGMSYGLALAGINVLAGIDADSECRKTYEANNRKSQFIHADITELSADMLCDSLPIKKNSNSLLLVGCSPCQFWSKLNTNRNRSKKSAFLLAEFGRFIKEIKPGWVIIENVPGIATKNGSILPKFLSNLALWGYVSSYAVLDLSRYGVPQTRHRFVLLATRLSETLALPNANNDELPCVRNYLGVNNGFSKVPAGYCDDSRFCHTVSALSSLNLKRIQATPKNGGSRSNWAHMQSLAVSAYTKKPNQFADVYARMSWDRPAPTITTRFNSFSNGRFGHPEEDRAISLREGATLQTFPPDYCFYGSFRAIARQIGNAVPPKFAHTLGLHVTSIANQIIAS